MIALALVAMVLVVLPRLARANRRSAHLSCTNHLKQIGLAYRVWATDNGDKFPAAVSTASGGAREWIEAGATYTSFLVMSNELNTPKILVCPEEKRRTVITATTFGFPPSPGVSATGIALTNNHSVTYFVGLDADETQPGTLLSGDDNFTLDGARPASGVLLLWSNRPVAWPQTRHRNQGNIGFADGSVTCLTVPLWTKTLIASGIATNRLSLP